MQVCNTFIVSNIFVNTDHPRAQLFKPDEQYILLINVCMPPPLPPQHPHHTRNFAPHDYTVAWTKFNVQWTLIFSGLLNCISPSQAPVLRDIHRQPSFSFSQEKCQNLNPANTFHWRATVTKHSRTWADWNSCNNTNYLLPLPPPSSHPSPWPPTSPKPPSSSPPPPPNILSP